MNTLAETVLARRFCLEVLDGNGSEEGCNMMLDVLHGLPMLSFQLVLQSRKQKEVARSQVGTVSGLRDHRGLAPGQVVANYVVRVGGGVVMVHLYCVFDVRPHARNTAFQSLQHLQVKGCIDSLSPWYKLKMDDPADVEKSNEQRFDSRFAHASFLGAGG